MHHSHPNRPRYQMPRLYHADPDKYRVRNRFQVNRDYAEIFRRYLVRAGDPVPHPLLTPVA